MRERVGQMRGMEMKDVLGESTILVAELEYRIVGGSAYGQGINHILRHAHGLVRTQLQEAFGLRGCSFQSQACFYRRMSRMPAAM